MSDKRLIIVGAQGSGEIAMSVFEACNKLKQEWKIEGYINDVYNPGEKLGNYNVIAGSDAIKDYVDKGYFIHYTYHFNVKNKKERVEKFKNLHIPLEQHATGIHPLAYVNPSSKIGNGSLLLPQAATSANADIGNFCHVYTNGFIGHDSKLSDYSTLAAHSILGARIKMGEGVHIGLNSSIREDLYLGEYSIIGMGSVVLKDVEDYGIVGGNPAKSLKRK